MNRAKNGLDLISRAYARHKHIYLSLDAIGVVIYFFIIGAFPGLNPPVGDNGTSVAPLLAQGGKEIVVIVAIDPLICRRGHQQRGIDFLITCSKALP